MAKLHSEYARIDVKRGRKQLLKRLEKGEAIYVTLRGRLSNEIGAHSHDDGVSIEFAIDGDVEAEISERKA